MENKFKEYLGDGAYVEYCPYRGFIFTAENGIKATDTVVLGMYECRNLLSFVERLKKMGESNGKKES